MSDTTLSGLDAGMAIRKEVLGDEHVERSMAQATEFSMPMQELVTEYCWGAIWSRPGLPRQTRSLLNLGMLAALNRSHELSVHVRGALRNGCSVEEIREVFMQAAIYVGVPAGLEAMRIAEEVILRETNDPSVQKPTSD